MAFADVLKVNCDKYDPLSGFSDLAPQLNLSIKDLRTVEEHVQTRQPALRHIGYITTGTWEGKSFFDLAYIPGRSIYSEQYLGDGHPKIEEVFALKGAGLNIWGTDRNFAIFRKDDCRRKYPILVQQYPMQESHKFWGGQTKEDATLQYVNALILNALIEKHKLPQATIKPISCITFKQLPVLENGVSRFCSLEDYCDPNFIFSPDNKNCTAFRLPTLQEAESLAEFLYSGAAIHLRVLPNTFKRDDEQRYYSAKILAAYGTPNQRWDYVSSFVGKLAPLVQTVHKYDGTFSYSGLQSSLSCDNVSLGGTICDLDTLHFDMPSGLEELQHNDLLRALQATKCLAELYDDVTKTRVGNKSYRIGYNGYALHGFGKRAVNLFKTLYPIPPQFSDVEQIVFRDNNERY